MSDLTYGDLGRRERPPALKTAAIVVATDLAG